MLIQNTAISHQNRIRENTADHYTERISFDKNSNITSLVRYGKQSSTTYRKIDDLTYTYNGNQLTAISDNAPTPTISESFNFRNGTNTQTEYLYDANGLLSDVTKGNNMTKDANKGITQILYNHLNLPSRITMVKGNITSTINYVYSASGAKLRVIHRPSAVSPTYTTTDYVNGYIFTNNSLSMALTDNGYYTLSSTEVPTYYFYLKDHQGNNRVVVTQNDSIVQTNHYYPYGVLFAESTNGDIQRFKYNGKELDRKFGLDWYDHGARHNDAAIGRWHSMDLMAEKYYGISPYAYCGGDPVNLGDYNGKDMCVLIAPSGAEEMGHMAILIQGADQKWYLYSKNGTNSFFGLSGPNSADKGDDIGSGTTDDSGEEIGWKNPQEFLNSDVNKKDGQYYYTQGYLIESAKDSDTAARNAACEELNKGYSVIGSNCAYTVQRALEAAGKSSGNFDWGKDNGIQQLLIPNGRYKMIVRENKGTYVYPSKK